MCGGQACAAEFQAALQVHPKRAKFTGNCAEATANLFTALSEQPVHAQKARRKQPLQAAMRRAKEKTSQQSQNEAGSEKVKSHATSFHETADALNAYSELYSLKEPPLLASLRQETEIAFEKGMSRMLSGPSQGAILSMLASLINAKTVLELGTFTGYATLCLAADFRHWDRNLLDRSSLDEQPLAPAGSLGRLVHTCEIDDISAAIASKYFSRSSLQDKVSSVAAPHCTVRNSLHWCTVCRSCCIVCEGGSSLTSFSRVDRSSICKPQSF
jgi:hypothetical protein